MIFTDVRVPVFEFMSTEKTPYERIEVVSTVVDVPKRLHNDNFTNVN